MINKETTDLTDLTDIKILQLKLRISRISVPICNEVAKFSTRFSVKSV
jgi:hypothetical protein